MSIRVLRGSSLYINFAVFWSCAWGCLRRPCQHGILEVQAGGKRSDNNSFKTLANSEGRPDKSSLRTTASNSLSKPYTLHPKL